MLLSAVISLTAVQPSPIFDSLGRPSQAWFLNQIMRKKPRLAERLHNDDGLKPYTVSTLLNRYGNPFKAGDWLQEGQECWLRVTTIGDELSEAFLDSVLKKLPKTLTIHKMNFRIDDYTLNPLEHDWAGQTTFAEGTRGAATGFTGTVGFSLLSKSKIREEWQPFWDGADVVMQSLSRFAFYCGVGHHSTIGMGQVRPIPISEGQSTRRKSSR